MSAKWPVLDVWFEGTDEQIETMRGIVAEELARETHYLTRYVHGLLYPLGERCCLYCDVRQGLPFLRPEVET